MIVPELGGTINSFQNEMRDGLLYASAFVHGCQLNSTLAKSKSILPFEEVQGDTVYLFTKTAEEVLSLGGKFNEQIDYEIFIVSKSLILEKFHN